MDEPELHDPDERKKEKRRARRKALLGRVTKVNAILIVAVVALSVTSASLFYLADHYHDSKYRAQYKIVAGLWDSLFGAYHQFSYMVDVDNPSYERYGMAVYSHACVQRAQGEALMIDAMYSTDSPESDAFRSLERALGQMEYVVASYESQLQQAFQGNRTYESNVTVNTLLETASQQMASLRDLLYAGFDQAVSYVDDPYSLIKRMDLESIESMSGQLEDTAHELRLLLP